MEFTAQLCLHTLDEFFNAVIADAFVILHRCLTTTLELFKHTVRLLSP
jgi:hypothetical protein